MNPFLNRICVRWFAWLLAPCLALSVARAEDPAVDFQHAVANSKKLGRTSLAPTEKGLGQFDGWPAGVWMRRLSKIEVSDESAAEIYRKKAAE